MKTIHLTPEEVKLLMEMLHNAPLTGNINTLPKVLQAIAKILQKLEGQDDEPSKEKKK